MAKWIALGAVLVLLFWGMSINNNLVTAEERVNEAWGQVNTAYQRRADLIPNLVNTVKGAANFEQETLTAVIDARSKASSIQLTADALNDPNAVNAFEDAQAGLRSSLSRLMVVAESYPQLQATQAFRDLQVQLEGTENRISTERNRFNTVVRDYNTALRQFPRNIIAGIIGFDQKPYFEAAAGSEQAPTVQF
jgi:LemA protein